MESQKSLDYYAIFSDLVNRLSQLTTQRSGIDVEIAKLKQLVLATFPLLPEEKQKIYQAEIDALEEDSGGLLNAIKLVFSGHKGEWLTASDVRDHLIATGFDLNRYKENPLASIGTTLRRMAPGYLEVNSTEDGQTKYQRRLTLLDQMGKSGEAAMRQAMARNPAATKQRLRPQERFKLEHTKGK